MANSSLPTAFAALEAFAPEWAIDQESARNAKRLASTMDQLRRYYDALLPRMGEIFDYLRPLPLDTMPSPERTLLHMALMFMEVAPAIEIFHAVDVPNSFEASRFKILPPFAQTAIG